MARIGYARVSTLDQDLDVQIARLTAEGCTLIRSEKGLGQVARGPPRTYDRHRVPPGRRRTCSRPPRSARRDTRDVLNIIHEVEQRGAFLTVLDPQVSTQGPMGHVMLTVLGMVAQMERRFIEERQREGIERAKTAGVYVGGIRRLDRERIETLHAEGHGPAAIARAMNCSRMQVYRVLQETGSRPAR